MAGRCIKPDCECLDYCEADDPYGNPQTKRIRCKPQSDEYLEYHQAWLNGTLTDKGLVVSMTPIDDGNFFIEFEFLPQAAHSREVL